MKIWIPITLGVIIVSGLIVWAGVKERDMSSKEFNFDGFTKVEVSGAFEVEIVQADSFNVSVSADDFAHIRVEKVNDTLVVKRQGIEWFAPFHAQPRARIAMPALADFKMSGASKGTVHNFSSTNDLAITVSGASHLEATNIVAGKLDLEVNGAASLTGDVKANNDAKFDISGASKLDINGAANNMILKVSGASKAELGKFPAQNADVEISGASNGTVNLNGKLNANVNGASNLNWSGTPIMGDIQISGASNLRRK